MIWGGFLFVLLMRAIPKEQASMLNSSVVTNQCKEKMAALYIRVSTPDQHVESQLYDLRQLAAQRGFEVVGEYTDRGISGKKARRPSLDKLIADARQKKFSVVLVSAFDRVARSTKHFLQVLDELDGLGIEFVSRRENVDTSGPMGRLFLTLIGSIAELEADLIKERIRAGIRRRKLEGLRLGRTPLTIDHTGLVRDRLNGMSLTNVAKRYGVSRASVVRFVRLAQQQGRPSVNPQQQPAVATVA
jgi:DNA invertase Pin-like site-specific DNA recombinase